MSQFRRLELRMVREARNFGFSPSFTALTATLPSKMSAKRAGADSKRDLDDDDRPEQKGTGIREGKPLPPLFPVRSLTSQ